jgi:cytochrome c oxidase cbb3-type subunit I/II
VGGRYSNLWHYKHMLDPRELSVGSNMPPYAHLLDAKVNFNTTATKVRAMRSVGVPYRPEQVEGAGDAARAAGQHIADALREEGGVEVSADSELVALIGYLQRLGKPPADDAATAVASTNNATRPASSNGGR